MRERTDCNGTKPYCLQELLAREGKGLFLVLRLDLALLALLTRGARSRDTLCSHDYTGMRPRQDRISRGVRLCPALPGLPVPLCPLWTSDNRTW